MSYDLVRINTVRHFGVFFFDHQSGQPYDVNTAKIEITYICNGNLITVLSDNMVKVDSSSFSYETLITSSSYPVNVVFNVTYIGELSIGGTIKKFEMFRTTIGNVVPPNNTVNIVSHPTTKSVRADFNGGRNL